MRKIKNCSILHALTLAIIASMLFSSCSTEDLAENPDTRLTVDKSTITAIITGTDVNGVAPTINILANRGFEIISDADWVKPQVKTGQGKVAVPIVIDGNDSGSTRTAILTVKSKEKSEKVLITQNLNPDTDDKLEAGYVYFYENFDWITGDYVSKDNKPISDYMTIFDPNVSPRVDDMATMTVENAGFITKWEEQGWGIYEPKTIAVYCIVGCLKFGTSSRGGGVISPALDITATKTTSVNLTFDVITNIAVSNKDTNSPAYGTGTADNDYMSVDILGAGVFEDGTKSRDFKIGNLKWNDWQSKSAILYGLNADTKVIFRSQKMNDTSVKSRWYLDNVKMVKNARN